MPVILGPDGPSLGGFVCPLTVAAAERWKLGQLRAGDTVRFRRARRRATARTTATGFRPAARAVLRRRPGRRRPATGSTYRRSGDRNLLVEYGDQVLDLDLRVRVHLLMERLAAAEVPGVVDVTPGIRSLQVHVDGERLTVDGALGLVRELDADLPDVGAVRIPSRVVHMPLSWDDPATREAIAVYMRVVRDDAPGARATSSSSAGSTGSTDIDAVHRTVFDASYLVLGLGDVYLGAPVATPLDPRHRLVTTKYNPARTWTPENAVGIGGAYLCIYGMEGPGGYQFVGRTVPVWSRHRPFRQTTPERPWLLRFFDQIRFHPVGADELLDLRADMVAGRGEVRGRGDGVRRGRVPGLAGAATTTTSPPSGPTSAPPSPTSGPGGRRAASCAGRPSWRRRPTTAAGPAGRATPRPPRPRARRCWWRRSRPRSATSRWPRATRSTAATAWPCSRP